VKLKQINPESFSELTKEFKELIESNETGSVLCVVYHKGKIAYCNKFGWKDKENKIPIEFDDIYRIYSMTKPIVCLAALILYDEGKFDLEDPLEKYLPEYKSLKILKSYNEETGEIELEESKETITIRHLFTHTSGISYGFYPDDPIDKLYGDKFGFTEENRVREVLESLPQMCVLDEFSRKLALLPLMFEPGSNWWYSFGHDILGLLIEKLSGKKLDTFLKENIFDKLGMDDTNFFVPNEKKERLVKAYMKKKEGKLIEVKGDISNMYNSKPKLLSGGGGLVSTLEDFLKFSLMMLNEGKHNGKQVISKRIIDLMTSNQLPQGRSYLDMQYYKAEDPEIIERNEGYGYGLGVIVKVAENMTKAGIGEYGWGGAANTAFRIDSAKQVITIIYSQHIPPDNDWIQPIDAIRISNMVYNALDI
jgi:CubicO group peptidase (beta-lactamase class C family)